MRLREGRIGAARMSAAVRLLAVALVIAGCGGAAKPPHPSRGGSRGAATGHASRSGTHRGQAPEVSPALARLHPGLARLQRALGQSLHVAGPATGVSVYDLSTGTPLFARRATIKRAPASLEKLYTTVALLALMGPKARLHTTVLGTGTRTRGGVWRGNLYLRGEGDPTYGDGTFNRVWEMGHGPTAAALAHQLAQRGIRRVAGKIIGDASLFDSRRGGPATGFAPDLPDYGGQLSALIYDHGATIGRLSPGAFAARQLATTLRVRGIGAFASSRTARTPANARPLARVSSPPLSTLLALMNVPSDDLFADLLTKEIGVRFGAGGTIADGARVISDAIDAYGIHPRIVDGSGLSRADSSSPAELVALLRSVWRSPIGHVLSASLPVVGIGGTVRNIAVRTAAQGHCIAKTGTLNYVTNLAGYCHSRGGHMLTFAFLLDGPPNALGYPLLSRMVAAVARY